MHFEHIGQIEEVGSLHYSARRLSMLPYRLCMRSMPSRRRFFFGLDLSGAMIRHWPSVVIERGVSGSMPSSSSTGLSMTRARLFPCFVSFFCIVDPRSAPVDTV